MSPERHEEIRALVEAATPAPWLRDEYSPHRIGHPDYMSFIVEVHTPYQEADAELIAAAPEVIRELLDWLEYTYGHCSEDRLDLVKKDARIRELEQLLYEERQRRREIERTRP